MIAIMSKDNGGIEDMSVGISDDYATLSAGPYMFYYGYEYTDDQDNWQFVVLKNREKIYDCLASDLGYEQFTDTSEVLLAGIGRFIEQIYIERNGKKV